MDRLCYPSVIYFWKQINNTHFCVMTPGHRRRWFGSVFYDARQIDGAALIDEEVRRSDYNGFRL